MCDVPPKRPIRQGTVDRVPWFTPNGLNPDSSPRARVFFWLPDKGLPARID